MEFAAGTESSTGTPRLGAAPPIIPSVPSGPLPSAEEQPAIVAPAAPATPAAPGAGPQMVPFGGIKPSPQ